MQWSASAGMRRYLPLLVSGSLVGVIGALGLFAGQAAAQQAREVHRTDRLILQRTLGNLVEQHVLQSAAEVADALTEVGPWSAAAGDPGSVRRLADLVGSTGALDTGAVLTGPSGRPLASWTFTGRLPAQDDPGWEPLRATARSGTGALPVSGILAAGADSVVAIGLPVMLDDGTSGMVLGLRRATSSGLQQYVAGLRYGQTGRGYVVDRAGRVVAGPTAAEVGELLPLPELRAALRPGRSGIVQTDDGRELVTSYAPAGVTGWISLTPQEREEFESGLLASSRLVQAAVVALLLVAGIALVMLHRKRERALEAMALRDELTGLYNRRGWFLLAEHELERARRQGTSRVLLFIDVDGLKQVNDVLGHREGDRALVGAAGVLRAASRSCDIVGRLGGDEFVLLLNEDGRSDVARRRLAEALRAHNASSQAHFELSLSMGADVWFPQSASTLDELVCRADAEMYAEKLSRPARHETLLRVPSPRTADSEVPTG